MSAFSESRFNHAALIRVVNAAGQQIERDHFDICPRLASVAFRDSYELVPPLGENWSRLAWRTLGNGDRWWIIADMSGVVDPFVEILPRQRVQYVAQLATPLTAGPQQSLVVDRPRRFSRGQAYLLESLDPAAPVSATFNALAVEESGLVTTAPFVLPDAVGVKLSRISLVRSDARKLVVPNINRALFEALDFGNSLRVLVE